jgi:hypothetical protein
VAYKTYLPQNHTKTLHKRDDYDNFSQFAKYCDVFGRMPSLLGNRKLNTSMDALTTRYCRVAW